MKTKTDTMTIRPVTTADGNAVTELIDSIYREYGDRVHLEKVDRDLCDPESAYAHGAFWVLDDGETIRGTVAIVPRADAPEACFLKRLYLDGALRGSGWGERLLRHAIDAARAQGFARMDFWTDVRFTRAHAFYEKHGFTTDGTTQTIDDAWEPYTEYFYTKAL